MAGGPSCWIAKPVLAATVAKAPAHPDMAYTALCVLRRERVLGVTTKEEARQNNDVDLTRPSNTVQWDG
jgi:hypothetical protein